MCAFIVGVFSLGVGVYGVSESVCAYVCVCVFCMHMFGITPSDCAHLQSFSLNSIAM